MYVSPGLIFLVMLVWGFFHRTRANMYKKQLEAPKIRKALAPAPPVEIPREDDPTALSLYADGLSGQDSALVSDWMSRNPYGASGLRPSMPSPAEFAADANDEIHKAPAVYVARSFADVDRYFRGRTAARASYHFLQDPDIPLLVRRTNNTTTADRDAELAALEELKRKLSA